ncbi:MAG: hypothetical protein NTZ68_04510 [Candidatus Dependentiae bacterium]|nr:hypothetical protein [Candidatus Dependentiae bacterium]
MIKNYFTNIKTCMVVLIAITPTISLCIIPHKNNLFIPSLLFQYRAKSTAFYSMSELRNIHKKKQEKLSTFLRKNENSIPSVDKDLITTYLTLQKKLNLTQVIPLFDGHKEMSAIAVYSPTLNAIKLLAYFHLCSLSQQLGILLHELRHVQQCTNLHFQFPCDTLALTKKYDLTEKQMCELDADLFVAKTIQCRTCLQIYQSRLSETQNIHGYACKKDFEAYVQRATTYCKAHSNQDLSKLNAAIDCENFSFLINPDNENNIIKLDNQIGKLSDRMPPFDKNKNK